MAEYNFQMSARNPEDTEQWDDLFPVTKVGLVEGLDTHLDSKLNLKVDKVAGKQLSTEDFTTAEKTKLSNIAANANNYVHPTGDGNQHVPATGTTNNGKVLKAGATAGSATWEDIAWGDVTGKPTTFTPAPHTHPATDITESATKRFVTDAEKNTWNAKQNALGFTPEDSVNKGVADGYASLDSDGTVPNSQLPSNVKEIRVVADIDARDALSAYEGMRAHVIDATDDPTVDSGWAEYLYTGDDWTKTAEKESIDIVHNWADIQGKPSSTPANIDQAVTQRHIHANKATLDKISATGSESSFDLSEFATLSDLEDLGAGDMLKAVYDTNNNGKVDAAETADAVPWGGVTGKPSTFAPAPHQHDAGDINSGTIAEARLPSATTSIKGIVQLSNSTTSTSTTLAATANAVKTAYDLASEKTKIDISATPPVNPNTDIWFRKLT